MLGCSSSTGKLVEAQETYELLAIAPSKPVEVTLVESEEKRVEIKLGR